MTIIKRVLIDAGGGSFLRRLDLSVLCAPDFDFAASHPTVAAAKMREHKERGYMKSGWCRGGRVHGAGCSF